MRIADSGTAEQHRFSGPLAASTMQVDGCEMPPQMPEFGKGVCVCVSKFMLLSFKNGL